MGTLLDQAAGNLPILRVMGYLHPLTLHRLVLVLVVIRHLQLLRPPRFSRGPVLLPPNPTKPREGYSRIPNTASLYSKRGRGNDQTDLEDERNVR